MDSTKMKTAISGIKKLSAAIWCLDNLTNRMISIIIQAKLRGGTNRNRKRRRVNPESIRLNPKIKSNLPPTKRIIRNWVKKIAINLKIFSFSSYKNNLNGPNVCPIYRLLCRITAALQRRGLSASDCKRLVRCSIHQFTE